MNSEDLKFEHSPVLLDECIEGLNIRPGGTYVDGTAGGGGHGAVALCNDIFMGCEYGKWVRFGLHRNGPISRLE